MNDLILFRKKINNLDKQIITRIGERMKVVKKVGIYKKQHEIPPLDIKRWKEVLESRIELGKQYGLSEEFIVKIYEAIHQEALEIEAKIKNEK